MDAKKNQCTVCSKKFSRRHVLNEHVKIVHMKLKQYECKICMIQFGSRPNCYNHSLTHMVNYFCDLCPAAFSKCNDFASHYLMEHIYGDRILCLHCGIKTADVTKLADHCFAQHPGKKGFVCTFCGQSFFRYLHLKNHSYYMHFRGMATCKNLVFDAVVPLPDSTLDVLGDDAPPTPPQTPPINPILTPPSTPPPIAVEGGSLKEEEVLDSYLDWEEQKFL